METGTLLQPLSSSSYAKIRENYNENRLVALAFSRCFETVVDADNFQDITI